MTTTLLENARIIDGTGAAERTGHVLIDGANIANVIDGSAVGEGQLPAADKVIDVAGNVVAPGFIDMHSHMDFVMPDGAHTGALMAHFVEQGITSVVAGNCGLSPAPVRDTTRDRLRTSAAIVIDRPLDWRWHTMGEYLDALDASEPMVNVAQLVGHGALRYAASDKKRGDMSAGDLKKCLTLTEQALDEGACGLSFGLGYDPGMYSSLDELEAFCRLAAGCDRTVTSHLKAYSWLGPTYPPLSQLRPHNLRALDEMLRVATRAGARLQLSHMIFIGRRTWKCADEAIAMIDDARREHDVMMDAFPYTCGNTTINAVLPYWFLAKGKRAMNSRLDRLRCRVELEVAFKLVGFEWDDYQVMEIGIDGLEELNGCFLPDIAERWGMSCFDAMLELADKSQGATLMLFHSYSGDRQGRGPIDDVLTHEACLFETDALVRSCGWPNPAAVGTFPKILGDHVRTRKLLDLPAAIRRMTSASAARFQITDRGRIAEGLAADIVVFDDATISDTVATKHTPAGRPAGIHHVFVNGAHVVREGTYAEGVRAGRVLRSGA